MKQEILRDDRSTEARATETCNVKTAQDRHKTSTAVTYIWNMKTYRQIMGAVWQLKRNLTSTGDHAHMLHHLNFHPAKKTLAKLGQSIPQPADTLIFNCSKNLEIQTFTLTLRKWD